MSKEKFQWSISIVLLAVIMACRHHPDFITDIIPPDDNGGGINPIDTATNPCADDTVYFANTVLPIILSHCSMPGCHNTATGENDGIVLTNYNQIMNYVVAGNLNSSELWDDAIAETDPDKIMPPPDANALSAADMQAIETWILQGAENNSCSECDTTFAFSADILPIIQENCTGCHSGNNPGGSLTLTNYNEIQSAAASGLLMNRINGVDGIMPPNSNGIGSCHKNQIQSWINAGMPNN